MKSAKASNLSLPMSGYFFFAIICNDNTISSQAIKIVITARKNGKAIEINLRSCHSNSNKNGNQFRGVKSKSLNSFGFGLDFPSECSALQSDQSKTQ